MTRAAEFCYIAERADGKMLMSIGAFTGDAFAFKEQWTTDPEMAVRTTAEGRKRLLAVRELSGIGFRKILVG